MFANAGRREIALKDGPAPLKFSEGSGRKDDQCSILLPKSVDLFGIALKDLEHGDAVTEIT
jgi:hypothetical protein